MTTHTRYTVTCSCGHVGAILMSENDQPFSKQWESYSLENLDGNNNGYSVEGFAKRDEIFNALKPNCPECKKILTPSDIA